jgi:hypothetical protein
MMRNNLLDELIETGMQQGGTVDSIFEAIKANPTVRDAVQTAIDNPPSQGMMGPSPAQHIRQALMQALEATA